MNKTSIVVIFLVIVAAITGGAYLMSPQGSIEEKQDATSAAVAASGASAVTEGTYTVDSDKSVVHFAGKKPLIDGYVDSGSIAVSSGLITVAPGEVSATGTFTFDMNTLAVLSTPKKPGKESSLEDHLKDQDWFDVATYPTAKFVITKVTPHEDSDTTFLYDVTGNLTMKGKTNEITFPANIYLDSSGFLHAQSTFAIDRTKWGLTYSSRSFFDNLADRVIDDMVALSLDLVAERN